MKRNLVISYTSPLHVIVGDKDNRIGKLNELFKLNENGLILSLKNYDFHYYIDKVNGKEFEANEIVQNIIKKFSGTQVPTLIFLHTGNANPTFKELLPIDDELENELIKVQEFSGGNGMIYTQLVTNIGFIFPTLTKNTLNESNVESVLNKVWNYYYGFEQFQKDFQKVLGKVL